MLKRLDEKQGFTLVEIMVVTLILIVMIHVMYLSLTTGKESWFTTKTEIQTQEMLRLTFLRISKELRESGKDQFGNSKVNVSDGAGNGSSDILTFSIPIICETNGSIIDSDGNVANWGAPLTWGCQDPACMDADDDCSSRDYSQIAYMINAENQLIRKVLNSSGSVVREDVFAQDIVDFQVSLNSDNTMVTMILTASKNTESNRPIIADKTMNIYLRNKG